MQRKNKSRIALLIVVFPLMVVGAWGIIGRSHSGNDLGSGEGDYVKSRRIGGITYAMRYLPSRELIEREMAPLASAASSTRDSIDAAYRGSLTFMMTIKGGDDDAAPTDVLMSTSRDQGEYATHLSAMSFDAGEKIFARTGHGDIHPVLTHFEPVSGKANESCLMIVFPRGEGRDAIGKNDAPDIVFVDQMFGTGIQHFIFDRSIF